MYKVLSPIRHNGKRYFPGDTADFPEDLAVSLGDAIALIESPEIIPDAIAEEPVKKTRRHKAQEPQETTELSESN